LVDAGTHVQAGQPLLRLQDGEQRAAVAQARAALALASAQLGQVREVSDRVASAELEASRVAVEQARRELQRVEQLARAGAIAPQEVDAARDALASSSTRLAGAEARAQGAKGSEPRLAGARIAEARANLELAEVRLAQTVLVAPAAGTILERHVEPGDVVQPGKVLLALARDGRLRVEAQSDEKNLSWFKPGMQALITPDGLPSLQFPATLNWVSPAVDVSRGTVTVRFELPDGVSGLRPDMTVSVNFELGREQDALLIPLSALRDNGSDRPWVLLVRDGRTVRVPVTVGPHSAESIQVLSGLLADSVVVATSGIAEGARVRARRRP